MGPQPALGSVEGAVELGPAEIWRTKGAVQLLDQEREMEGKVQLLDQEREMAGAKGRGHMYLPLQEQEIWVQGYPANLPSPFQVAHSRRLRRTAEARRALWRLQPKDVAQTHISMYI